MSKNNNNDSNNEKQITSLNRNPFSYGLSGQTQSSLNLNNQQEMNYNNNQPTITQSTITQPTIAQSTNTQLDSKSRIFKREKLDSMDGQEKRLFTDLIAKYKKTNFEDQYSSKIKLLRGLYNFSSLSIMFICFGLYFRSDTKKIRILFGYLGASIVNDIMYTAGTWPLLRNSFCDRFEGQNYYNIEAEINSKFQNTPKIK